MFRPRLIAYPDVTSGAHCFAHRAVCCKLTAGERRMPKIALESLKSVAGRGKILRFREAALVATQYSRH